MSRYNICYALVPCLLCSAVGVVTSFTVGVASDGVSGTVLVDAVLCEHMHIMSLVLLSIHTTHQQHEGCSASKNSLLVP